MAVETGPTGMAVRDRHDKTNELLLFKKGERERLTVTLPVSREIRPDPR